MNINFKFKNEYWSNFYFFVRNLSEWHFSRVKKYNLDWKEQLKLGEKDESFLSDFKNVRLGWPPSNSIFEKAFYFSEDPFEKLEEELNEKELDEIKQVFDHFKSPFELVYSQEKSKLVNWKKELEKDITSNQGEIVKSLEIFYNEKIKDPKEIICFLQLSTTGHSGSYVHEGVITLELSNYPIKNINSIISTIWHETIHACFDKYYLKDLLTEMNFDDKERFQIKELIASSLFPYGELGKKYFNLPLTNELYRQFNVGPEKTKAILELTGEYLESSLTLDKEYINKIYSIK